MPEPIDYEPWTIAWNRFIEAGGSEPDFASQWDVDVFLEIMTAELRGRIVPRDDDDDRISAAESAHRAALKNFREVLTGERE